MRIWEIGTLNQLFREFLILKLNFQKNEIVTGKNGNIALSIVVLSTKNATSVF